MSPAGGEWLNDLAAQTVRLLNRCYLDGAAGRPLPAGFPCPDDLRGVARRRRWRLPGVYFVSYNALGFELCGRTSSHDAIHADQTYLPLLRALLAGLQLPPRGREPGR